MTTRARRIIEGQLRRIQQKTVMGGADLPGWGHADSWRIWSKVIGKSLTRTLVACHTALAIAAATPVVPSSPIPCDARLHFSCFMQGR
jgi:hypothetical protein